ncbi:MAG: response regulator [Candidatus Melainabacteria bacterium]|jgi:two-component system, response regulator PdtaR|nr:response regulator [Candidatus Melainabacteria bacterium]
MTSTADIDQDLIKVVIADDEPLIRMDLKELLEEASTYKVVAEAKDGDEAVKAIEEHEPDIVFMDIRMPNKDGIAAAKEVQEKIKRRVPIIMLTAYSQPELFEEAAKAGVFTYLTKPLRKADLAPAIEIAIARAIEMTELKGELDKLNNKLETRKIVEKAKGLLMKKFDLDETTAYRRIQKAAMDQRSNLKAISEAILKNIG